jgi:hypothetical protein
MASFTAAQEQVLTAFVTALSQQSESLSPALQAHETLVSQGLTR